MSNFFRLVVVGWNVEKYIRGCIESILYQDFKNWTMCIVLDPSNDKSYDIASSYANDQIKVISNTNRLYATANIVRSICEQHPEDEDIIATVDGDDWLSGSNALSIVDSYYQRVPDLLVTHGSWVSYPNPSANTNNAPYHESDWKRGIRKVDWRASHLRTFKYKVWKHIKAEDLCGPDGKYAKVAWDLAIMYPMLEMAGAHRVKFIPELLYVYNQETPFNDGKMRLKEQMAFADYFASKQPYTYRETF